MKWLEILAVGVVVFEITGSPFYVALMVIVRFIPLSFFGFFNGLIAERINRRMALFYVFLFLSICCFGYALSIHHGVLNLWLISLSVITNGFLWALDFPIRRTLYADFLNNEELGKAITLDSVTNNFTRFLGPIAGGLFVENVGFYSIVLMSIFLAPNSIMALWGGSFEIFSELNYLISIALTLTCSVYFLVNKFIYKNHDCSSSYSTYKTTMLHAVLDVAMVVTYVFIGLFIANYLIDEVVGTELFSKWMTSSYEVVVFLAALIAVTPGCGGMIAVAVAFITIPNFPISALIAAAIATSGDGIFPLIAENKKDGFIISLFGLIIALFVGYIALFIGV